ncbi:MAG: KEOPS complex kinase/ATPase Bud32 [archaeon]|nr:KEOPS complex kinase/ATPase Bud32 [archaeon]
MELIKKGAEANIYLDRRGGAIVKDRVEKGYRVEVLDRNIRKMRTKSEAKLLDKACIAGVPVPKVISSEKNKIVMEYISGDRVKDILDKDNVKKIVSEIGKIVARLHSNNIIHGDLTTSNFIFAGERVYLIDFGLGCISTSVEKKAVDIHLFEEALESTHPELYETGLDFMINAYRKNYCDSDPVLKRVEDIRKRGRYITR